MRCRGCMWVLTATAIVSLSAMVAVAGQDEGNALTRTWIAVPVSTDAELGTATFKAAANAAAIAQATQVVAGQDVILRWDGIGNGEGNRVTTVVPVASGSGSPKVATGRGQFAMRARYESLNSSGLSLTFTIPLSEEWRGALSQHGSEQWLRVTASFDRERHVTTVTGIEPLVMRASRAAR